VIGDGASLPLQVQAAFSWVVREAVTNVIRDAHPAMVRIELDILPAIRRKTGEAVLRVEDDSVHGSDSNPGAGTGPTWLRERLVGPGGVRNYLSSTTANLGATNRHEPFLARNHGWI